MAKRNVVLTGFMGTGKSTVGRLLAAQLNFAFVDTDELIEARGGRSIADIFREHDEEAFRRSEARVALELGSQTDLVIATGGRLMLDKANAAALGKHSHVFCLTAAPQTILSRLLNDGGKRPLLAVPHPAREIERLLKERKEGYGRFPQVNTDDKMPDQVVAEIMQQIDQDLRYNYKSRRLSLSKSTSTSSVCVSPVDEKGEMTMYFCDTKNREAKEVVPGIRLQTFWGENMLLSVVELDAGAILPSHSHPHEQSGAVISGILTLTIAGETRDLTAGDAYLIPGGVEHSAIAGPTLTKVVDIFSPVREEYKF